MLKALAKTWAAKHTTQEITEHHLSSIEALNNHNYFPEPYYDAAATGLALHLHRAQALHLHDVMHREPKP